MAGTFHGEEFGFDGGGFEFIDNPDSLFVSDVGILGAVYAESGSGQRRDPVQRAGDDVSFRKLLQVASQPEGQHFGGIDTFTVGFGKITGAEEIDDASDVAGLFRIASSSFEASDPFGDGQELRQVSAGGSAGSADAIGIDVVFLGVGSEPADGCLDVVDGGGELVLRSESIADGDGDVAVLGESDALLIVAFAVACSESAAVNADDGRKGAFACFGTCHVELQMLIVRVGIFDVFLEYDIVRGLNVAGQETDCENGTESRKGKNA